MPVSGIKHLPPRKRGTEDMRVLKIAILGGLLAAALAMVACGDDDDDSENGGVREVTVQALADLRYEPSEITVKVGEPVRIVLENVDETTLHDLTFADMPATDVQTEGGAEHEMDDEEPAEAGHDDAEETDDGHEDDGASEEGAVHLAVEPGKAATVTFTPTVAGEYEFHCTVGAHAEAGMVGTLIVEA